MHEFLKLQITSGSFWVHLTNYYSEINTSAMKVTGRDSIYKLCLVQYLHTNEYQKVIVIINSTYYICHHTHKLSSLLLLCCLMHFPLSHLHFLVLCVKSNNGDSKELLDFIR